MDSNPVEQSLVVIVAENAITQMMGQFLIEFPVARLELFRFQIAARMPSAMSQEEPRDSG
ncbi:MAG: hypothetical protein ACR2NN_04510 [Bryobacteraceae bacterium]